MMAAMRLQQLTKQLQNANAKWVSPIMLQKSQMSSTINPDNGKIVMQTQKTIPILDSSMSYVDIGSGNDVVLFLHGNPTSSYLWRNVIPHVEPIGRCLAPDLIGMGQSGKEPNNNYRFVDHFKYLNAWINEMKLPRKLHFVVHDWGSGLGFHWCNLNRDRVASITFLEALVAPVPSWDNFPELSRGVFQALRSTQGEEMVLKNNFFVTRMLPWAVLRELTEEEMATYVAPYKEEGESRRPTLTWPREIPVLTDGPEDVCKFASDYAQWLSTSNDIPKLYVHVEPGFFSPSIIKAVKHWPNVRMVTVRGHHFAQEDSPNEIGLAIKNFIMNLKH